MAQTAQQKWWGNVHPAIKRFFTTALTEYVDTSERQNYIGANAAAYERQMLPLYALKGPGEVVLQQLITYAPPVYVQQTVVPTGLAGIGAGQIWNGGLQDIPSGKIVQ